MSAYAGWAGSLPADVAEQRLRQALVLVDRPPEEFLDTLLPTVFSDSTPPETVQSYREPMLAFHPAGFRTMSRASAEDLRGGLDCIDVPTLLVYGDSDVQALRAVAESLHARNARLQLDGHLPHPRLLTWSAVRRIVAA